MAEYVFPALFRPNDDGTYTITFPDLPGCISEGKTLGNAMYMAQSALTQWLEYLEDNKQDIPAPSSLRDIQADGDEFVSFVRADLKDGRAVKRTVSIPKWMDDGAMKAGLSLSRVLQDALRNRLQM